MRIEKPSAGDIDYIISSFCRSYKQSKVGKHLYNIEFVLNLFLLLVNKEGYEIVTLKEGNKIKAWVLHNNDSIHYYVGSIANIKELEKSIQINLDESLSIFYLNKAKGWIGSEYLLL